MRVTCTLYTAYQPELKIRLPWNGNGIKAIEWDCVYCLMEHEKCFFLSSACVDAKEGERGFRSIGMHFERGGLNQFRFNELDVFFIQW